MIPDVNFYNAVRETLHKRWEPIEVFSYSEEMGEYDGYTPNFYKILREGVADHRVIYEVHGTEMIILVVKVGHRKSIYKR